MAEAMSLLPWTFSDVDFNNPAMIDARTFRNETAENRVDCLESLIDILCETCFDVTSRPNLDINFLMRFLRGSSFKTSLAFKRIKRYYACHHQHSDIFKFFLPFTTLKAQSLNHVSALPFRAKDNSIVLIHKLAVITREEIIHRFDSLPASLKMVSLYHEPSVFRLNKEGKFDPNVCSFEELMRLDFLIIEALLLNPVTQLCGITVILDLNGISVERYAEFSPTRIQSIFEIYDRSLTLRIVGGHIINAPVIIRSLYNLLYNKINEGLRESLVFHEVGEWKELHSQIPPEILPEEYHGTLPSSELVNLYDLINANEDYFLGLVEYGMIPESRLSEL